MFHCNAVLAIKIACSHKSFTLQARLSLL